MTDPATAQWIALAAGLALTVVVIVLACGIDP